VVEDTEKVREYYSAAFGLGPWWTVEQDYPKIVIRGHESAYKIRVATTDLGGIDLKLIQLLSGRALYSEFLDKGHGGFHHLTLDLARGERDVLLSSLQGEGYEVIEDGESVLGTGANCVLLDTDKTGGVIFKLRYRPAKAVPAAFRMVPPEANQTRRVKWPAPSQIGSVVKDLDRTMAFYAFRFGVGPWRLAELDYHEIGAEGRELSCRIRTASVDWSGIELELVQPASGDSLYSAFLAEGREGLHHLTFDFTGEAMEQTLADLKKEGIEAIQRAGNASASDRLSFLKTDKMGGAVFKLRQIPLQIPPANG